MDFVIALSDPSLATTFLQLPGCHVPFERANSQTRTLRWPCYTSLCHPFSYLDWINDANVKSKRGYAKIDFTCEQALRDELFYVWVDCCCIDKTSSAELSEAINSMLRWYARAAKCYAYLSDIFSDAALCNSSTWAINTVEPDAYPGFAQSRWFRRGWTLQELIAPKDVVFFASGWKLIGNRNGILLNTISEITNIDVAVLSDRELLPEISVAKRMSWAANRRTTRKEDEAYCLLGIFGVNIPLLYGKEENAFVRLQEEIVRSSTDQSIFAWK